MSCIELREKLTEFLSPIITEEGFDLVELDWRPEPGGWTLRLVLDKEGRGVTLEDCSVISRKAGQMLDESSMLTHSYSLEVSSPGLLRALTKEKDYRRFLGDRARIELKEPMEGSTQKVVTGYLQGLEEGKILLTDGAGRWHIRYDQIAKACLDPIIEV